VQVPDRITNRIAERIWGSGLGFRFREQASDRIADRILGSGLRFGFRKQAPDLIADRIADRIAEPHLSWLSGFPIASRRPRSTITFWRNLYMEAGRF
jgi:hypothetical protein